MSTTSLKLPDSLRQRVLACAKDQGTSPHAFMVEAIEQAATLAEQRNAFIAEAQASLAQARETGEGYDAEEVHAYLKARLAGEDVPRPKAGKWRG